MELTGRLVPGVVELTVGGRLDEATVGRLLAALDAAEEAATTRAVVLRSDGDTFCAGLALDGMTQQDAGAGWRPRLAAVRTLFTRLHRSPLFTVAVVDGTATGGGVGLAAACDHVIAGPRASFRLTEVLLGLFPALVLPLLAGRVGAHRAYHLALTAAPVDGTEAHRIGLADEVTPAPTEALRRALVGLRTTQPGAVLALKRYRAAHLAPNLPPPDAVEAALAPRFADPALHRRLAGLRAQGLLA
jgi:polyketide biosynthesis enoyl-CoA hydratase PksH